MTLLKMSFYGAVIILVILLIRAVTLHKLPKKTFLILWGVALLRLLVPFEIDSGFSLYSLLPELPEGFTLTAYEEPYIPDPANPYEPFENYADYLKAQGSTQIVDADTVIIEPTGGAIYLPNETTDAEAIPLPDADTNVQFAGETTAPDADPSGDTSRGILQTLILIVSVHPHLPALWLVGVLLCTAFFLISYIRCYLEFRTSLPVTEDYAVEWLKQHPLKRTISIRQSDKISAPLTYGLFRPVILMPKKTDWTNFTQLDYVLYHEFTHIRRFDLGAKLVMIAALCLHWFNPFVWIMYFFFNRDLELSCDDCVVKHFKESKADYAHTLIGMEEKKNYSTPLCNHFSKNAIEERITAIMKSKKTTIGMIIAAVVLVIVVVVTLTTDRKEETAATDMTPTVTPTETAAPTVQPTSAAEPTPPPGAIVYSPETNYTYSNKDSLAKFDYNSSTISPKDGYDFIISTFVSEEGEPILSDLTLHLEPYAGNTAWWCLAAFYDKDTENVYLEFVPAAGVEDAPSGILHVTIPVADPAAYTVLQAGDFHAQKASAFWFSDICKIQDKIYFNNGSCNGSLWVYDITTGKMTDLTYVNEKMQELANELCSGFGWEHDPAIWFHVSKQVGADTYVYTASVCKEMDTETIYTLGLWYEKDKFVDYSATYQGSSEQPQSMEELTTLCQEQFFRYQEMQDEFFNTNLKCASLITSDDWVTINGEGGYTKVLDERFPTLQSVIDYMETICTPAFANTLRNQNWNMNSQNPTLAELDGELYTKCYDAVSQKYSYRFSPVSIDGPDTCTLTYEAYIGIPANKTESGTVYFQYMDGSWHIWHHEYTHYNDFVDGLDLDIFADLIIDYHTMHGELFRSGPDCGMHSYTPAQPVTINGVDDYYKVVDERFPTMQSVIDYMETICTPVYAETLRNNYLRLNSDVPLLAEVNGVLYTQYYSSSTWNDPASFRFTEATILDSNCVRVGYQGYNNSLINVRVSGTIDFVSDGGWRIDSITTDWGNPYFDAYNGEKLQIIECTETGSDSPNYYNDIIFYRADEGETIEDVLIAMKTDYDVTAEPPYQQIDMFAWRVPFHAQGSDEIIYFILLEGANGVYRLQREEAAKAMLSGTLTYYDPVYEEMAASGSIPTTDGPDWYNAVSELMNGNTPEDTLAAELSFSGRNGKLESSQPSNENGHVFTISHLEYGKEQHQVLKNLSVDLSTYTTSYVWAENGIFYDEEKNKLYVVFSPTDLEAENDHGMVDYQVLLAVIPADNPEGYSIRCYGNPESPLNLRGSYTYGTTKIDNLIYLGESCHGDTFYTIDINTMGLTSLSYVNDALHVQAKSYLEQCGFGTEFALSSQVVCKTGNYTVFSADISYSFDNSPTYFTVYHAYDGEELVGKVILRHLIPFYDAINESHVNAMYISMDDVVTMAKEQFEKFCDSKNYNQPYKITSIHMTSFETIEVEFLIPESDNFDIYTEGTVDFTYNFATDTWSVSHFRETPPDYLSSYASFPTFPAGDVVVVETGWDLTFLDELYLPRYSQLKDAGASFETEAADNHNIGRFHTAALNEILYFFVEEDADERDAHAWHIAITSPDYPLSGGTKVGMTVEELLALYPDLAKTNLTYDDPVFEALYGPSMFNFRDDQFPESFLVEYDYAYTAYLDKGRDGLPVCIAFLIKNDQVGVITVYMPTAG